MLSALQYCPECEAILSKPEGHNPPAVAFRLTLRLILPLPDDDDATTVASAEEEETDHQKVMKQISAVDDRLGSLEGRFDTVTEKMTSLEDKMDKILGILSGLASSPIFMKQADAPNQPREESSSATPQPAQS